MKTNKLLLTLSLIILFAVAILYLAFPSVLPAIRANNDIDVATFTCSDTTTLCSFIWSDVDGIENSASMAGGPKFCGDIEPEGVTCPYTTYIENGRSIERYTFSYADGLTYAHFITRSGLIGEKHNCFCLEE